jgi:hypothetical protein
MKRFRYFRHWGMFFRNDWKLTLVWLSTSPSSPRLCISAAYRICSSGSSLFAGLVALRDTCLFVVADDPLGCSERQLCHTQSLIKLFLCKIKSYRTLCLDFRIVTQLRIVTASQFKITKLVPVSLYKHSSKNCSHFMTFSRNARELILLQFLCLLIWLVLNTWDS